MMSHGQEIRQKMLIRTAARLMLMYWGKIPANRSLPSEGSSLTIVLTRKIVSEGEGTGSCNHD